jgi:adenine-specific DNA-methyltransferase
MVQLEEECPKDSEAYKSGYKNICEIGKERIRRAGEKVKADAGILGQDLDIGFRVFKLDSTNMKDVYYAAKDYTQAQLNDLISNIKEDRTDMDLLFACLLEWGLPLSLAHKTEKIDGFDVHTINDGDLMACFADEVSESVIREIAKRQPLRAVFRDSSFGTSPEKINVEEIFKLMSPKTKVKVI